MSESVRPKLVAVTMSRRTPPITPLRPESLTVVLPSVDCVTPGGSIVVAALLKSSIETWAALTEATAMSTARHRRPNVSDGLPLLSCAGAPRWPTRRRAVVKCNIQVLKMFEFRQVADHPPGSEPK